MSLFKTLPFLGRLFTVLPPIINSVPKDQFELDQLIPQLHDNLYEYSLSFVQATKQANLQYLQEITKPALFEIIQKQLTNIQQNNITINQTKVLGQTSTPKLVVMPYEIFGEEVSNREKHHFDYPLTISENKFFNYQKSLSPIANFRNIKHKKIYGFHCYLICFKKYYFTDQKGNILKGQQGKNQNLQNDSKTKVIREQLRRAKAGHQFFITFETDSSQLNFQIVDCNFYLQNLSKK